MTGGRKTIGNGSPEAGQFENSTSDEIFAETTAGSPDAEYATRGGELSLSNPGQLELLTAVCEKGGALRTIVRGFSMTPFIRDRDVLTIVPYEEGRQGKGDVVAFCHPDTGRLVIHRIIGRTNCGWLVQGDNCHAPDGVVGPDQIIGVVRKVERNGRKVYIGCGPGKCLIALLSRTGLLMPFRQMLLLPRRSAGFLLRQVHGLPVYRMLGRKVSQKIEINAANEEELEQVYHLLNPGKIYKKQPPNPNVTNLVATKGNRVVGVVQLVYRPVKQHPWDGYWLYSMHVETRYRGLGLGEKLAWAALAQAKLSGASKLLLTVNEDNRGAVSLYKKLGFTVASQPDINSFLAKDRERTGRSRLLMQKDLEGYYE